MGTGMGTKYEALADRQADNRFIAFWISHFDEIRARVNTAMPAQREKIEQTEK